MTNKIKYFIFLILCSPFIFSQKINTDSLLVVTHTSFSKEKDYKKTIKLAQLGIKNAPNYLDFHLVLARAYQKTNQSDSARFYYKHVIANNIKYKDAFTLLTKLEIDEKKYDQALIEIDNALEFYPDDLAFYKQKLQILYLLNDNNKTLAFLKNTNEKFPDDKHFNKELEVFQDSIRFDRIGINYSYTAFNRDNYGPWHYSSLEYSRQRQKATFIGRINYTDRRLNGSSNNSGFLYEIESYFKNTPKSYSYANFGFSPDENAFPKIIASYSYYQNLGEGWESELGARYSKRLNQEFFSGVLGMGKYFGSNWLNLRTYGQFAEKKIYLSFTLLYRYYFNTRYDYVSITSGYGTSPDERETLSQFQNRIALKSKRIGIGYNKQFNNVYYMGIQGNYNYQEYFPTKFQNEFTISLSFYYKL